MTVYRDQPRARIFRNYRYGDFLGCARIPLEERVAGLRKALSGALPSGDAVAAIPRDLLARTAAFLLLKDSRSSFAIEGEHPPQDRIKRWGRAIGQADQQPIDLDELLRLQSIVIGDARFVRLGLRGEGGFVGERDRESGTPIPVHISARPESLTRRGFNPPGIVFPVSVTILERVDDYRFALEDYSQRLLRWWTGSRRTVATFEC